MPERALRASVSGDLAQSAKPVRAIGRKARRVFASLLARIGVATEFRSDDQFSRFGGPAPRQVS